MLGSIVCSFNGILRHVGQHQVNDHSIFWTSLIHDGRERGPEAMRNMLPRISCAIYQIAHRILGHRLMRPSRIRKDERSTPGKGANDLNDRSRLRRKRHDVFPTHLHALRWDDPHIVFQFSPQHTPNLSRPHGGQGKETQRKLSDGMGGSVLNPAHHMPQRLKVDDGWLLPFLERGKSTLDLLGRIGCPETTGDPISEYRAHALPDASGGLASLLLLDAMHHVQSDRGRNSIKGEASNLRKHKAFECALNFGSVLRRPLLAVCCDPRQSHSAELVIRPDCLSAFLLPGERRVLPIA